MRAIIIEDDHDIAEELQERLEEKGFRCRLSFSGNDGLELIRTEPPDLLVLDVMIPGIPGQEVLRAMEKIPAHPVVLAITGFQNVSGAELYGLKVHGFFRKPFDVDELVSAALRFMPGQENDSAFTPIDVLTERENIILGMLCQGMTSQAVAGQLGISSRTVEQHRNNLRRKLSARNTAELIRKALQMSR